jgi:opacity protein-like surface antigen
MKKFTILIAALIVLIPSLAYSDMMTVRLGYYMPQALNNLSAHPDSLWGIELTQMSMLKSDYRGSILGGGYEFFLTRQVSFAISVDTFSRENGGYYLEYVGIALDNADFQGDYAFPAQYYTGDFEVLHSFRVSMTPVQFSLKFTPLGRKTRLIPYVGGGAGLYFLSASIRGSMVDFSTPELVNDPSVPELGDFNIYPVVGANAHETRVVLGYHAFAGFMFPIGYRLTLEAEARYHFAKVNFREAFPAPDFEKFDLSGLSLSIGLNYWF